MSDMTWGSATEPIPDPSVETVTVVFQVSRTDGLAAPVTGGTALAAADFDNDPADALGALLTDMVEMMAEQGFITPVMRVVSVEEDRGDGEGR